MADSVQNNSLAKYNDNSFQGDAIPNEQNTAREGKVYRYSKLEARTGVLGGLEFGGDPGRVFQSESSFIYSPSIWFDLGVNGRTNFSTQWALGPEISIGLPLDRRSLWSLQLSMIGGAGMLSNHYVPVSRYFPAEGKESARLDGMIFYLDFPRINFIYKPSSLVGLYFGWGFHYENLGNTKADPPVTPDGTDPRQSRLFGLYHAGVVFGAADSSHTSAGTGQTRISTLAR
jgi:hypothetical protein